VNGPRFRDRRDAAEQLARRLDHLRAEHPIVLGLPRGGVPVAAVVAERLHAPLDILVVRKLGVPYQREFAMGAVGEEGARVLDDAAVRMSGATPEQVARVEAEERLEVDRRARRYRNHRRPLSLAGRTALIVDDGIATGSTARVAAQIARARGAARVILAAPVIPADRIADLRQEADEVVVVAAPELFGAVGQFYDDFSATSDDEVTKIVAAASKEWPSETVAGSDAAVDAEVGIALEGVQLHGRLTVPTGARGTVLFAHGSGSSSRSPRNRFVAERLNEAGIGTLLFDLLTASEERDRRNVFDIALLTARLRGATHWLRATRPEVSASLGYFGASTGAAAALRAAADPTIDIDAVVSRGGRADLAAEQLEDVRAPTLLIVGGEDDVVLGLNRAAASRLRCEHEVVVIPGATHLFEESGALEAVAGLASAWFLDHLGATTGRRAS
jgi:putative phosphoribosyl transferase